MIRPEHQFYIRPDLHKAASTKAESTTAESAIRPKQLVREIYLQPLLPPKVKNIIKVCSNEVHPLDFTIIILSAGVT